MSLIAKIKRIRNQKRLITLEEQGLIKLSKESYYCDGFRVEVRHPEKGHLYLQIGNDSIVDGHYIFEKDKSCTYWRMHVYFYKQYYHR